MRPLLVCVALITLSSGCGKDDAGLEERFFECRDLLRDKETRVASLDCFSKDSRAVIAELIKQRKKTQNALNYMRNYGRLLDYETVAAPPDIRDDIGLLLVSKGSRQETTYWIREEGEWRVDGLELAGFWAPLDNKDGQ